MIRTLTALAALCVAAGASPLVAADVNTEVDAKAALARQVAGDPVANRPLAKLRSPLCLVVAAEDQTFGFAVAERILDNARAAGVPIGRPGCRANTLVNFSEDAVAQMQAVRAEGRKLFRRMSEKEIDAALSGRDPVYVFQAVQSTPRFGQGDADVGVSEIGTNWTKERSVLRTPEDLLTAMVVFEKREIAGKDPMQLADYATLRLLAPTGEFAGDAASAPHTILSLFAAPAKAPEGLTVTDRAYLKSLYAVPRTAFAEEVLEQTVRIAAK